MSFNIGFRYFRSSDNKLHASCYSSILQPNFLNVVVQQHKQTGLQQSSTTPTNKINSYRNSTRLLLHSAIFSMKIYAKESSILRHSSIASSCSWLA